MIQYQTLLEKFGPDYLVLDSFGVNREFNEQTNPVGYKNRNRRIWRCGRRAKGAPVVARLVVFCEKEYAAGSVGSLRDILGIKKAGRV